MPNRLWLRIHCNCNTPIPKRLGNTPPPCFSCLPTLQLRRAEVGMKTIKRLITNHSSPNSSLNRSPSFSMATRQIQIPNHPPAHASFLRLGDQRFYNNAPKPSQYSPQLTWSASLSAREEALRNRHTRATKRWPKHIRKLPPLIIGNQIRAKS